MKRLKKNNGITLVALIITIIVLLILAVVAIRAVQGDGIIKYAKNAKTEYQAAGDNEAALLQQYEGYLNNSITTGGETQKEVPAIGDKVAYNEGSGKTSTVDSAFVMDNLEWRVLDVEADGTIELISTKPTTSKLTLSGEDGWLSAEENLDKLCNDLYANGTGVTARSLKVEDVEKLGNYDPTTYTNYGSLWRYKYDAIAAKIQYSKSTDNGATWTDYADGIYSGMSYVKFKAPGEAEINSTNYQDTDGNPIVKELKYDYYYYTISSKVTQTTTDGISMASLISQGLNDTNDASSGSNVAQWLSSRCVNCFPGYAGFNVRNLDHGNVVAVGLWTSFGHSSSLAYAVRPVVSLPSSVLGEKVDGVWQVTI